MPCSCFPALAHAPNLGRKFSAVKNAVGSAVTNKQADYLFTVKDNQPTLRQDIESLHLEAFPPKA